MWTGRRAASWGCDLSISMNTCFSISSSPQSDWFTLWPHMPLYSTKVPEWQDWMARTWDRGCMCPAVPPNVATENYILSVDNLLSEAQLSLYKCHRFLNVKQTISVWTILVKRFGLTMLMFIINGDLRNVMLCGFCLKSVFIKSLLFCVKSIGVGFFLTE